MSVIETTLYSFGGNMETNRFEEYWESFKWADNIYTGFININHVIEVEGFIKAFEAYVTRTGCIQFLVSQSVQYFLSEHIVITGLEISVAATIYLFKVNNRNTKKSVKYAQS